MAYEDRNGRQYYYRKQREGKRVISEYIGSGEVASLIAQMDEIERDAKAEKAEEQRQSRETTEMIDGDLSEIERNIKDLTEVYLTGAGFYKTDSREWRVKTNEK